MTSAPRPAWLAERTITAAQASAFVYARYPRLAPGQLSLLAEGWDNTVFRLQADGAPSVDAVFRFPRRAIALPGVRREIGWLPLLAPRLPLDVPLPRWRGLWAPEEEPVAGEAAQPWPWWGSDHLPGRELPDAAVADGSRDLIASAVGRALRALHELEPAELVAAGTVAPEPLPRDPMRRGDPAARSARTRECLDRLAAHGCTSDLPHGEIEQLLTAANTLEPPETYRLCHGDLHVRHILVTAGEMPRAAAIIDWGDLCVGDPAIDLSIGYGAFAGTARVAFLEAYGPVDTERELRARALAIGLNALLAEYAASRGDAGRALLDEALRAIARALR